MRWTLAKIGAVLLLFFGWLLIVVPLAYWVGVEFSGFEENPDIVQGWGSDAIDVAIEEVLVALAVLSVGWLVVWGAAWRWVNVRALRHHTTPGAAATP